MMATSEPLPADDKTSLHKALADTRRRQALDILSDTNDSMRLETLAAKLAERDGTNVEAEAQEEEINRLKAFLYHKHAPLLDDTGIVEFDSSRNTLALDESSAAIEPYL